MNADSEGTHVARMESLADATQMVCHSDLAPILLHWRCSENGFPGRPLFPMLEALFHKSRYDWRYSSFSTFSTTTIADGRIFMECVA